MCPKIFKEVLKCKKVLLIFSSSIVIIEGLCLVVSFCYFNYLCCMMVCGCKQYILYILVTLFSTQKQKTKNSNLPQTFQTKWSISFSLWASSLPLTSQNNLCHIIWIWKSTPKISPTITSPFKRLGMILVMKMNCINQKTYIRMFTKSILSCLKKNQIFAKHFTYFQIFEIYFSNCHKFEVQFKYLQVLKKNMIITI
jgi:hypothetical protein